MRGPLTGWVALSLATALVPTLAAAEAVDDSSHVEARELSQQAQTHYNLGRFEQALEGYSRVYELFQHPAFLFNIGQCHRELGHCDQAVFFFEGYLRGQPHAVNAALVSELIEECRQTIERLHTVQAEMATPGAARELSLRRPVYRQWWFWTILGVALAGVVIAGTLVGVAADQEPETILPTGSAGTVDWR